MKLHTFWWGAVLIPEDRDDYKALERVASACRAEGIVYEEGTITWRHKDDYEYIDNKNVPMDYVLEIAR